MKTMIARVAVLGALLAAGGARADGYETYRPSQSMYILNYEIAAPVGSFSDKFIKDTSWRGISFESRSMVHPSISAGIGFTFNRFEQTYGNVAVTNSSGGTLSGPVYRYADQFAVKGLVHGYFLQGPLRPYLGLGIGGVWSYSYSQSADLTTPDNGFSFILSPEVGLTYTVARGGSSVGFNAAFRYNYTTADFGKVTDAQTIGFVFGFFGAY